MGKPTNFIRISEKDFTNFLRGLRIQRPLRRIIMHHSYSPAAKDWKGVQTLQAMEKYQQRPDTLNAKQIAYHIIIDPDGGIWLGRPLQDVGAHTRNHNKDSIGICMIGNFMVDSATEPQYQSALHVVHQLRCKFGKLEVGGHKDYVATACPGVNFNIKKFKEDVEMFPRFQLYINDELIDGANAELKDGALYVAKEPIIKYFNIDTESGDMVFLRPFLDSHNIKIIVYNPLPTAIKIYTKDNREKKS